MESKAQTYEFIDTAKSSARGGVTARIAESLREAIAMLEFAPGAVLDKQALCRRFGVSRYPVSEALSRLQTEGLVDIQPQRGSMVSLIRLSDARENMFLRRSLEAGAVRVLAAEMRAPDLENIERNLRYQTAALAANDRSGFHRLDLEFHEILLDALGFPRVKAIAENARLGLDRVRRLLASPQRQAQTLIEHKRIADALTARDGNEAANAMTAHLDAVTEQMMSFAASRPEIFADVMAGRDRSAKAFS